MSLAVIMKHLRSRISIIFNTNIINALVGCFAFSIISSLPAQADDYDNVCDNAQYGIHNAHWMELYYVDLNKNVFLVLGDLDKLCSPACRREINRAEFVGTIGLWRVAPGGKQRTWKIEGDHLVEYHKGFTPARKYWAYPPRSFSQGYRSYCS